MQKKGFSFVEILAPCPTTFGKRNKLGGVIELTKFFHERSVIRWSAYLILFFSLLIFGEFGSKSFIYVQF